MRRTVRSVLAILALALLAGLAVLWLWPLPPSGADISVLAPDDPAQAEALMEEIDAYIRAVEETYARAVFHRRLLTVFDIMGVGILLLFRYVLKQRRADETEE